jgi:colicin import membrane protein
MEKIVEKVKELTLLEKLDQQLIEARTAKESKIKPLEEKFKKQVEAGKFREAEATMKQIQKRQEEAAIRIDEKGKVDRRDINVIAKEEGISTIGKSKEQIRKEILEKRKEKKPEEQKKEAEKKEKDAKEAEKKVEDKADALFEMVKMIKELVAKIEPKLPTHALAL